MRKKKKTSRKSKKTSKPILKIAIGILVVALVYNIFSSSSESRNPNWIGWVYPDANNLTKYYSVGQSFPTLQDCRASALNNITNNNYSNADYECGHMCRYDKQYDLYVCKETSR